MPNFKHVEYMVFPRLCALAEVDWSPKASHDWDDFSRRMRIDCLRLDQLALTIAPCQRRPKSRRPTRRRNNGTNTVLRNAPWFN